MGWKTTSLYWNSFTKWELKKRCKTGKIQNNKLAIQLAKKALAKDPKYVNYDYRKEQLWGEKLQSSTEILLQNEQLKKDVILAKSKITESS